jgi:hypothetical protein
MILSMVNYVLDWSRSRDPGANPTNASYNASAVKIYDAASSLGRFENNNIIFLL